MLRQMPLHTVTMVILSEIIYKCKQQSTLMLNKSNHAAYFKRKYDYTRENDRDDNDKSPLAKKIGKMMKF
jgi:hypothetical protein